MNAHADFAAGLLQPTLPAPAVLHAVDAATREHRYAVHRNNSTHALVGAFEDGFPVLRALVGADCFAHAARACARAMPPRTPVLAEHVQVFPAFIADGPLVDALPYLADVARLEAACLRVFHAADAPSPPLDTWQRLQADPQRLAATRLRLHPACAWLACTHAAVDLWQAHMRAESMESADLAGLDPDQAQDALLWRDDDGLVQVAALPPGCAAALDALQAGAALLPVLSRLPGDAAATLLAHLAGDGVVTDILVPTVEAT
jgi:hypothetical protein